MTIVLGEKKTYIALTAKMIVLLTLTLKNKIFTTK